ncbi:MAG: DEAD/DEAH box helicase, partial [Burkholderiaceae bacterium]|nr:DEAD/DEAH box helicase [Burkholderiaceae bacterium]
MSFNQLGLSAELLAVIGAQGYTTPTPIQQQAIPAVLAGHDMMACAQTGTGKTAAFVLPILHRLMLNHDQAGRIPRDGVAPRVLVLVPTRELAVQVEQSVRDYGRNSRVRSLAVYGGARIGPQFQALRRGVDFLVATPGRLMDHMQQRTLDLRRVEVLILDEADRMLDMGFIHDIRSIVGKLPAKRQSLMFSATFSDEIRGLAREFLTNPRSLEVAQRNATAANVTQVVIPVERDRKKELLLNLFENRGLNQVLVFTRTKHGADS